MHITQQMLAIIYYKKTGSKTSTSRSNIGSICTLLTRNICLWIHFEIKPQYDPTAEYKFCSVVLQQGRKLKILSKNLLCYIIS